MESFIGLFYLFVSGFNMYMGILMKTKNNLSLVLFKVIPIGISFVSLFLFLYHYKFVINVN